MNGYCSAREIMSHLVQLREYRDPAPAEACAPCDLGANGMRLWARWCHTVAMARVGEPGGVAAWLMLVTQAALFMTFQYATNNRQLRQEPKSMHVL